MNSGLKRLLSGAKPCVLSGKVASVVAEVESVSAGAGLDLQKLSTKSAQDCSESLICI